MERKKVKLINFGPHRLVPVQSVRAGRALEHVQAVFRVHLKHNDLYKSFFESAIFEKEKRS